MTNFWITGGEWIIIALVYLVFHLAAFIDHSWYAEYGRRSGSYSQEVSVAVGRTYLQPQTLLPDRIKDELQ